MTAPPETYITIEIESGFDSQTFDEVGLDEEPTDAASLLALIKQENKYKERFISDWDLMDDWNTTITVSVHRDGKTTQAVWV